MQLGKNGERESLTKFVVSQLNGLFPAAHQHSMEHEATNTMCLFVYVWHIFEYFNFVERRAMLSFIYSLAVMGPPVQSRTLASSFKLKSTQRGNQKQI